MSSLLNLCKRFKEILRAKKVPFWVNISKGYPEQPERKWGNFKSHVKGVK